MQIKILLFILFLFSPTFANDIFEYKLDGISIGNSLLDHYSYSEITSSDIYEYPGSNRFYDIFILSDQSSLYENYSITVKLNDDNYIIYAISGEIVFNYQIEKCFNQKNSVINEIKNEIPNAKQLDYEWQYTELADGQSMAYITEFELNSGSIRVYCVNSSDKAKKSLNFPDYFALELTTHEVLDWLTYEANTGQN